MVPLLPLPSQETKHIDDKFHSLAGSCLFQLYALGNQARFPICAKGQRRAQIPCPFSGPCSPPLSVALLEANISGEGVICALETHKGWVSAWGHAPNL